MDLSALTSPQGTYAPVEDERDRGEDALTIEGELHELNRPRLLLASDAGSLMTGQP